MIKLIKEDIEGIRYCVIKKIGDRFYELVQFCDGSLNARKLAFQLAESDDVEYWAFDTKKWKALIPPIKNSWKFNSNLPIYRADDTGKAELLINYVNRVVNDKTGSLSKYSEGWKGTQHIEKRLLKYIPKRLQPYVVWLDYEPSSHVYFLTFEKDGVEYSPDPADDVAELAWNARQYTDILLGKKQESLRKESYRYYGDLEGLDDTTLDIIRKLDELDYYGIKPIKFGKDTLMSFSKNYFTDKKKSNGVTVDIDPLNGYVTVTEFIYDVDGEDLTELCPVKKVRTVNDVIKIDRWAKNIRKWEPNVIKLMSENRYGYVHDEDEAKLSPSIRYYLKRKGFIPIIVNNKQYHFMDFNYGNLFCDIYVDEWGNCYLVTDNNDLRPTDMFYTITETDTNVIDDLITLGNTITSTGDVSSALDVFFE